MTSPFNDYDENGYRTTINGGRSSRTEDEAIIYNLRYRWPRELANISDARLVNEYDQFALSELWGDNDERFLAWLEQADDA